MADNPETLTRPHVDALDSILGMTFKVLDDGFVRAVDYMGSDEAIVQAARVSYGKGTKQVHEDRGLIRYLMRHKHTTPFEMCELKLHVRVPMDCWRQWIRHRTANVNEYSTRYSEAIDSAQRTGADEWRLQATSNRQGSLGSVDSAVGAGLTAREAEVQQLAREVYEERLAAGVAREQARKDLTLSTYTEAYWKIDLHNLFHFLALRMDRHAQAEIRAYATIVGEEIVRRWCPLAWEAFSDYVSQGVKLTRLETEMIKLLTSGQTQGALVRARELDWINDQDKAKKSNRERQECEAKLSELGFAIPWN